MPMRPTLSSIDSHSLSRMSAFFLESVSLVRREPKPWPSQGLRYHSFSAGPRSAMRPLPSVPAAPCCSAIRPLEGNRIARKVPSVPGIATWQTMISGSSIGSRRIVSARLSQKNTSSSATSIVAAVREPVDSAPIVSRPAAPIQYALPVRRCR